MFLKKILIFLQITQIFVSDKCVDLFDSIKQQDLVNDTQNESHLLETSDKLQIYRIDQERHGQLGKYFELGVMQITSEQDLEIFRASCKYKRALQQIDTFGRFFPLYCSYFETGTNNKYAYIVSEKGGQTIQKLIEKGSNRLLSFLEKFAIMKKIAKIVTILHFYQFIICELNLDSFKVYSEQSNFDSELLTDQFQAQNLKFFKTRTLVDYRQANWYCPLIKKFQGNEAPEAINRDIVFDNIEKKFRQRQDIYQMVFIFLSFFLDQEEMETLNTLALSRNIKNLSTVNEQIITTMRNLMEKAKTQQIPKEYHLSFNYLIALIDRMLQLNPSDRIDAYDVYQALILIIQKEAKQIHIEKIKSQSNLSFPLQEANNAYSVQQLEDLKIEREPIQELIEGIYEDFDDLKNKQKKELSDNQQHRDDSTVTQKLNKNNQLDKNEKENKQNSV